MKKIDVYINEKRDLIENYSADEASVGLVNYILKKVMMLKKDEDFTLNLYVTKDTKGCTDLIKEGLKVEYNKSKKIQNNTNVKQLLFFLLGICLLFVSTVVSQFEIIREIFIITAWVPIWEAVEFEIFNDSKEKQKRRCITKLLNKEFNEIESDNIES